MKVPLTSKAFFRSSILLLTFQWTVSFLLWSILIVYLYGFLDRPIFFWSFVGTALLLVVISFFLFFEWYFKQWTAQEEDFIWMRPWPQKITKRYPLDELRSGKIEQSFIQKLCKKGTIHLVFQNKEKVKRKLKMPWIHNPKLVLDHVERSQIAKFKNFLTSFNHGVLTYTNGDQKPHSAFVQVKSNPVNEIFFKTCKDFRKYQSLGTHPLVSLSFGRGEKGILHIKGVAHEIKEHQLDHEAKENIGTKLIKRTEVAWHGYAYFQIVPTEFRLCTIKPSSVENIHLILD